MSLNSHTIDFVKINSQISDFGFWKTNFYRKPKSSHPQMFFKIGALKKFEIFTGKHMYWSHFNKDAGRMDRNFIKKRIQHGCFPKNNAKFLRQHFLQNTFGGCFWKATFFQKQQIPSDYLQETDSSFFKEIYNELEKDCLKLFYYYFFNILGTSIFCETATLFENLKSVRKNNMICYQPLLF